MAKKQTVTLDLDALKEDAKFKQYRRIVKEIERSVDIEKLTTEVNRLHAGRKSRNLHGRAPSGESLQEASLQDSSNRSRMAEIRVETFRQQSMLEEALAAIKRHVMNEYRDAFSGLRTKGERLAYVEQYLNRGISLNAKLENFMERIDFLIRDIDQTGFALRNAINVLEIVYAKNSVKNV
jgi:hypothetical protein